MSADQVRSSLPPADRLHEPREAVVGGEGSEWEALFWTVFSKSRNAMAIVSTDRRVVSANPALQRLLGSVEQDLLGRAIDEALPVAERREIEGRWHAMLARGESHGDQELITENMGRMLVSFAAHVAQVARRLIVLVVVFPERGGDRPEGAVHGQPAGLTPREAEIVGQLALGATSRQIADELYVTPETVRTHVRNAMLKTRTRTRAHLVAAAICRGLLPEISRS